MDSGWELRTSWPGRPLSVAERVEPVAVARVVAGAAATLADLHEMGVVHGHLRAEHVGVGPTARTCLCGFGPDDGDATPADDVAALGAMLTELLAGPVEVEAIPERRFARRGERRRGAPAVLRRSLLTLADQASDEIPTRRPTASRLAADLAALVDGAAPPDAARSAAPPPRSTAAAHIEAALAEQQPPSEAPTETAAEVRALRRAPRHRRSRTGRWLALMAGGLALTIALVAATRDETPSPALPTPASAPAARPHPVTDPGVRCAGADGILDIDGDGCPEDVQISGSVITVGERRWSVGDDGDVIEVGDWNCDGKATPAVLRPSSGEVFLFPSWSNDEVVVDAVDRIPGARDLARRAAGPGGCAELAVMLADGRQATVHTEVDQ